MKLWKAALSALVLTAALTLTVRLVLAGPARTRAAAEQEETLENLLPGGSPVVREGYQGEDESVTAVFRGTWRAQASAPSSKQPVRLPAARFPPQAKVTSPSMSRKAHSSLGKKNRFSSPAPKWQTEVSIRASA